MFVLAAQGGPQPCRDRRNDARYVRDFNERRADEHPDVRSGVDADWDHGSFIHKPHLGA
ncbi:hypothetical protein [Catenulispora rubra]|uniref:hypothetical protein n=1 Tax=Catenulispora rubra TaxID=280293 RepID=UPI001E58AB7A|nr:hypothetical protein [Catenulispora rubra]